MKESQESGKSYYGSNDILTQALGTLEYGSRVRGKGKHYTHRQFFHSVADRAMQDFVKASEARQAQFEAGILAKLSEMVPTTPQSDMGSCNLKTNHVVPEFVEYPQRHVQDQPPTVLKEPQKKVFYLLTSLILSVYQNTCKPKNL